MPRNLIARVSGRFSIPSLDRRAMRRQTEFSVRLPQKCFRNRLRCDPITELVAFYPQITWRCCRRLAQRAPIPMCDRTREPVMQECNASALLSAARCVPKFCRRNIRPTCRECGAGEGHMHNRIGRRAAVAGVDRMAVEDVMASVLHFLPNEAVVVLRRARAADPAMRRANPNRHSPAMVGALCDLPRISKTTDCAFRMGRTIT